MILQPGGSYAVQVTVANQSLYMGEPSGADLTIAIEAALGGVALIPHEQFEDWYEPGESKTHAWSFVIPEDIGESSGAIAVEVRCPHGTKLAEASVDIHVESVDPGELRVAEIFLADWGGEGKQVWAVLQGVVPDGRSFFATTRAGGGGQTVGGNRDTNFYNGVPVYMNVFTRSGRTYEWITVDIYDYQGGPLLTSGRLDFDPPYYQE